MASDAADELEYSKLSWSAKQPAVLLLVIRVADPTLR
jgi:hypothetical protein